MMTTISHPKKRIQFVLPGAGLSGGVKVIFEYANRLHHRGHEVRIIYPGKLFPSTGSLTWQLLEAPLRAAKYAWQRQIGYSEGSWFPLEVPLIRTPSLEPRYLPDAEVVIATASETAEWVAALPPSKGEKFYLIQGWEDWSRGSAAVEATWRLPLRKVVISSELKAIADRLGVEVVAVIVNGVDSDIFYNQHKQFNHPPRVLMLSHHQELKGIPDGFQAIAAARQEFPELRLSMFGLGPPRPDMPPDTEYHRNPTSEHLRQLYCSHDLFLSPSWQEGCQLPPMEAMACGCAVVATNVGGIPDYAVAGKTALVVPPHQPELLTEALLSLLRDEKLLQKLATAGQRHIAGFTWERATDRLESVLVGED